jgi:hypothetical protein
LPCVISTRCVQGIRPSSICRKSLLSLGLVRLRTVRRLSKGELKAAAPTKIKTLIFSSIPKRQRHQHIHACIQKEMAAKLGCLKSDVHYCYHCFAWVAGAEWEPHCRLHLSELASKRCGVSVYCHTLVRPAYCPFCLGDDSLAPTQRIISWTRDHELWKHVHCHIKQQRWPTPCPHPLCDCDMLFQDSTSLQFHFVDYHTMSLSRTEEESVEQPPRSVKRKLATVDWMPSEGMETYIQPQSPSNKRQEISKTIYPSLLTLTKESGACPELGVGLNKQEPLGSEFGDTSTCFDLNLQPDKEVKAASDFSPLRDDISNDDLFAEFLQSQFIDYSTETAMTTEHDPVSRQCSSPQGNREAATVYPVGAREKGGRLRLYLRLQPQSPVPPRAKITLHLKKPNSDKASRKLRPKRGTRQALRPRQRRGNGR